MQYDEIKKLIDLFETTDLNEMELTVGEDSLRLSRGTENGAAIVVPAPTAVSQPVAVPVSAPAAPVAVEKEEKPSVQKEGTLVEAPIVGTFYASAAPDKPPYVSVGDVVAEGDTLCIIEAMKFMNEVPSPKSGTIQEILMQDGEFVEYGQPLFRIV